MSTCLACLAGWHNECLMLTDDCDCCGTSPQMTIENLSPGLTSKLKDAEEVKDQTSTGRKRAAAMYPIPSIDQGGMVCEWSGLSFAGGGAIPIVGCNQNLIAAIKEKVDDFWPGNIHHGPDKSTLNNSETNVHRICPACHNRWHALNDPFYPKNRPESGLPYLPLSGDSKPHDSGNKATAMVVAASEQYWALKTKQRELLDYETIVSARYGRH